MKKVKLFITAILLVQTAAVTAQVDLQNTGILFVTGSSDIVYVNGGLTNTSTAALTNNGSFYVRNNLSNAQVSMAIGTGTLYLTGSVAQSVGGTQPFRTFNLNTNNGSGITLNANLSVSGAHTFVNGIIASSVTPNYLVYEAGSSHSGSADNRHVSGWVKKHGNTNFTFPVGNGTYLRNAALSNLSALSEFNCKYLAPTPNPTNVAAPILLVDNNEYWDIPRISGGTAQVTLNWDNSKVSFPPFVLAEIRVVSYTAGLWTTRGGSATGNIATTGSLTSAITNDFGFLTFGSTDWFVPVKFLGFTAQRRNNYSQLDWSTTKEFNADRFDVERSDDGLNFRKIGVTTANNSAGVNAYQYNDHLPLNGTAWYRIKSIDKNGQQSYSIIALVTDRVARDAGLYVVNNPVRRSIFVSATGNYIGTYEYSIVNAAGQLMQKGSMQANGGISTIQLTATVAPGVYILDLKNSTHRLTERIVVQ
ncbi:MAG: T9SS type A sorting domain-containing protein [Chitinophagaceae bacterium]|nr:T9SS type A sorting domain-containing protein [Chitinophagaceae bacterium]